MKLFNNLFSWVKNQEILYYIFLVGIILPNIFLAYTENVSILTKICNIILPFGIFSVLMTLNHKPGKMFWWLFLFVFLAAFQLVLLYLFGEAVIAVDMFLNLVTTNAVEATELLGNIMFSVIAVFIIYGSSIVLSIISIKNNSILSKQFINKQRIIGTITTFVGIILTIININVNTTFKINKDIYPVNVCYNLGLAIERSIQTSNYLSNIADYKFNTFSTHSDSIPEVYVFVIGETARALNFGIYGYHRNTTPELNNLKSELHIFTDALTESNTTHKSVPMLLSAACADNYEQIYSQKSIISAFKEAGFHTSFISNQRRNNSFIDFFAEEADNTIFIKDNLSDTANVYDLKLVELLKKELSDNIHQKKFIILHTYGSHFDYHERYPRNCAIFKPDYVESAEFNTKNELINSFDNSIYYTDKLLGQIINTIKNEQKVAAVLYTSDHGEDIFDDERHLFLHASPTPSFYQLYVPFIVWLSDEYALNYPNVHHNIASNSHKPISTNLVSFHSLLSIAGIEGNILNKNLSVANREFTPTPRSYLNDHNEPTPLTKLKLKELDINAMKKNGVEYK